MHTHTAHDARAITMEHYILQKTEFCGFRNYQTYKYNYNYTRRQNARNVNTKDDVGDDVAADAAADAAAETDAATEAKPGLPQDIFPEQCLHLKIV